MNRSHPHPRATWRPGRCSALTALLAGSIAIACATTPTPGEASSKKLVEWIHRWLGNPPIATGGTRGSSSPPGTICLLHPWLLPAASPSQADLAVARPVLASATPLKKIKLWGDDHTLLGETSPLLPAKSTSTLMAWPQHWPSLEPGRRYELSLQPASSDNSATIVLQTASAEAFQQAQRLQERLGSDPAAWEQQIQALLTSAVTPSHANRAMAAQLLYAPEAPPSPRLTQLRQALQQSNCSPAAFTVRPQDGT